MAQRKDELTANGVSPTAEETMIKCRHVADDTPTKTLGIVMNKKSEAPVEAVGANV